MKVLISRPKPWFGPFQLAELLCWWAKDEQDQHSKPDWVHRFGEWLAYGTFKAEPIPGERYRIGNNRPITWLYRGLLWLNKLYPRVEYVKIDRWDCWSGDKTLSLIILPLLLKIKENKQGAPWTDDEDVPDCLKSTAAPPKENEWDIDEHWFARWDYILDEMIYAFEQIQKDWEQDFYHGESDIWFEQQEDKTSLMVRGENDTSWVDYEGLKKEDKRIQQGLLLFGKYYRSLWS